MVQTITYTVGGPTYPDYDIEIRNDTPYIASDNDDGTEFDLSETAHRVPDHVNLPNPVQRQLSDDVVYAATENGRFVAYPVGPGYRYQFDLRAHLAWYDSDADEFTILEFVEE